MPCSVVAVPSRLVIVSFVKSTSASKRSLRRGVNSYHATLLLYAQPANSPPGCHATATRLSLSVPNGGSSEKRVAVASAVQRIQPVPVAASSTATPLLTAPKSRQVCRLLLVLKLVRLLVLELDWLLWIDWVDWLLVLDWVDWLLVLELDWLLWLDWVDWLVELELLIASTISTKSTRICWLGSPSSWW